MIKCPVCDEYEFEGDSNNDVCDICGWENDGLQYDDHDDWEGPNRISVNEARLEYSLLGNEATKSETLQAKQLYLKNRGDIRAKYKGVDYQIISEKMERELEVEHERYVNTLTAISQRVTRSEKKKAQAV